MHRTEPSLSTPTYGPDTMEKLRNQGFDHVHQAAVLLEEHPSTNTLKHGIDAAENALNGGVYRSVTTEGLRQV